MRKSRSCLLLVLALFAAPSLQAQSIPDEQKAEVAIEIRMDRLRQSPMYDAMKMQIDQARQQANLPADIDLDDIDSVFIAVALPETVADMAALENMEGGGELPLEFYARMSFTDSSAAESLMSKAREEFQEREINGKTYYAPPEGEDAPSNILAHQLDDKTVEMGTVNYLTAGTGDHLLSSGLATAWSNAPEAAIRIAVDLQHASTLITEGVEQARENAPPEAGGFLDLVTKANDLYVTVDFAGEHLITFAATGKNAKSVEELHQGLNAMLGLGKFGGQQAVKQMEEQDPDAARIMKSLLDSMEATVEGDVVRIAIPRPEGFDDLVQKMMQMSGGGGAPGADR